jgi:hypothetical protein
VTCTYDQSINSKSRQDDIVRDIVLALAIVVIFGPFALLPFVI